MLFVPKNLVGQSNTFYRSDQLWVDFNPSWNVGQGKKIIADVKKLKLKIQIKIQGEELRAEGKKRDDLQEAIAFCKKSNTDFPLQYQNFRD